MGMNKALSFQRFPREETAETMSRNAALVTGLKAGVNESAPRPGGCPRLKRLFVQSQAIPGPKPSRTFCVYTTRICIQDS